jgi:hypothetical protein
VLFLGVRDSLGVVLSHLLGLVVAWVIWNGTHLICLMTEVVDLTTEDGEVFGPPML